ncbi:hypothetical protein Ancab_005534 [Ancistrocladus abbreviatus]
MRAEDKKTKAFSVVNDWEANIIKKSNIWHQEMDKKGDSLGRKPTSDIGSTTPSNDEPGVIKDALKSVHFLGNEKSDKRTTIGSNYPVLEIGMTAEKREEEVIRRIKEMERRDSVAYTVNL